MQTVTIGRKHPDQKGRILISDKIIFKTRNIINDKVVHYIMKSTQDVFHGWAIYWEDKKLYMNLKAQHQNNAIKDGQNCKKKNRLIS